MLHIPALPYTREDRRALLDAWHGAVDQLDDLRRLIEEQGETEERLDREEWLVNRILAYRSQYRQQTPIYPLARCPFTGLELQLSIDTFGLDGPWWDYDDPVRQRTIYPETAFSLAGAVALAEPLEYTRHIVYPGPGVPYVLPRLLAQDDTAAVLSSVPIGGHRGFAITYFGYPPESERPIVDEWGRQGWDILRGQSPGWDTYPLVLEECDFDLVPWLESGKLLWIEPGDATLALRVGVDGCPYTGPAGTPSLQTLFEGGLS